MTVTDETKGFILIVEDEPDIQRIIQDYLVQSGFRVQSHADGAKALAALETQMRTTDPYDLVVLDVMLPSLDGLEVCQKLRTFSQVPVVFLTARHDEIDRLLGLRLGADDYISKPFSPREMVARIEAILRRTRPSASVSIASAEAGLHLDSDSYQARLQGQVLELTPVEFRLLNILAAQPGRVFRRDQLVQAAYDDYRVVSDRTIDSHIKNLRTKLQQASPELQLIHSVYGVGYRYEWSTVELDLHGQ